MGTAKPKHKFVSKSLLILLAPVAALAPISASYAQSGYPAAVVSACSKLGRTIPPPQCSACHVDPLQGTFVGTAAGNAYSATGDVSLLCPAPMMPSPTPKPTATPTPVPTIMPTTVPTIRPTTMPTTVPTIMPTTMPTIRPTIMPTERPTPMPTIMPTPPVVRPPRHTEREREGSDDRSETSGVRSHDD